MLMTKIFAGAECYQRNERQFLVFPNVHNLNAIFPFHSEVMQHHILSQSKVKLFKTVFT